MHPGSATWRPLGAFFLAAGRALALASAACAAAETGFEPFFLAAARAFSTAATCVEIKILRRVCVIIEK